MDLNVRAFRTVQAALEEKAPAADRLKKEASRRGGLTGGKSRAKTLTAKRRKEIALAANAARWGHRRPVAPTQAEEERQ